MYTQSKDDVLDGGGMAIGMASIKVVGKGFVNASLDEREMSEFKSLMGEKEDREPKLNHWYYKTWL